MKKILKTIFINLIIMLVLLMIVDPFFKSQYDWQINRNINLREHPPSADLVYTPADSYIKVSDNLEQKAHKLRTDKNGYILGPHEEYAPEKGIDIMFMGGSTTEYMYVDEDKRFPYLVGAKLSESMPNGQITTVNAGFPGNNSFHSTINILAKGIKSNPRLVVLMHNINDLATLTKSGNYWITPQTRDIILTQEPKNSMGARFSGFWQSCQNLIAPNLSRKIKRILSKNSGPVDEWGEEFEQKAYAIDLVKDKFEKSLMSFYQLAKANDLEVVLMTQSKRYDPKDEFIMKRHEYELIDYEEFCGRYAQLNDLIRAFAEKNNITLIDLDSLVPSTRTYIYDEVHLNTDGSELVANLIAERLKTYFEAN